MFYRRGRTQSRTGLIAVLLVLVGSVVANQTVAIAATTGGKGRTPEVFWDQGIYYCLANRDLVYHGHNGVQNYSNRMDIWTEGREKGSCFTPAYPASVRSQLIIWYQDPVAGNQICTAFSPDAWRDASPSTPAFSRQLVDLTFSLPCGNNRPYAVGGNHEGLWWPGGIDWDAYISPMQVLHYPVI